MSDFTVVQLLNQPTPVIITGGYVPRGAYAAGTDYAVGDSVDYLGSSYVMYVDAAAGTLPTDTTKWQIIANKGATGSQGIQGETGETGTAATATAGTTTTGAAGSDASVVNSGTTAAAVFDFTIPRGDTGATGSAGADGADGADGAAATIAVGTVTTVDPSDPATVTNSGTSAVAVFDFEIPKGDPGTSGHVIKDEGTPLTARAGLNFVGAGVTATDDAGNDQTIVTIPSTDITGKASLALDNLASVAINTSLISDTDSTDDLGSTTKQWANVHTDRLVSTISDLVIENDLSDGDITFKVNDGGVDTTVMTLDGATGRVGIGTTAPGYSLEILKNSSSGSAYPGFAITNTNPNDPAGAGYNLAFSNYSAGNGAVFAQFGANYGQGATLFTTSGFYITTRTNSPIIFATGASTSEKVRIDTNGNVGIGTSAPISPLHIEKASDDYYLTLKRGTVQFGFYLDTLSGQFGTRSNHPFYIYTNDQTRMAVLATGNVGIGTTAPTNILSLGGNVARVFASERHTTANTAGNTLTVTAGGATSGATDKAGGALILQGGLSTGSAESGVTIQGCVAGASGTTDRTQTTMIQVLGNKVGFFTATPVVQQTELTDELTTITFTAPGTPDYAIQDLTDTGGFGFATKDEGNSVLAVVANLQARVNELETKLVAYGLLLDAD